MIERGIKINYRDLRDIKLLIEKIKRYKWIYIGGEFCENILDLYLNIDKILKHFKDKKICFLTPIMTDNYMNKLLKIVEKISGSIKEFEISVNDFGALNILIKNFPGIKVNIGRHLSKHFFSFRKGVIKFNSEFSIYAAMDFEDIGIKRYDISAYSVLPKNNFDKADKLDFRLTMFYPYALLSTTRACLIGLDDIKPEQDIKSIKCRLECLCCDYYVKTDKVKEKLVVCENSMFVKVDFNKSLLYKFSKMYIDRFVFCPSP